MDNVNLNENLASVCGEQGAIRFLQSVYGYDSKELKKYLDQKEDYDRYSKQMLVGTHLLDSLYSNMNDSNMVIKKISKDLMIKSIIQALDTVSFHSPMRYKKIFENKLPNNAYFIDFIRYDSQKEEMKKVLIENFQGNIRNYIEYLKLKKDSI